MVIEKVATLVWRFVGLFVLLVALPGFVLFLGPLITGLGALGEGAYPVYGLLPMLLILVQVAIGVIILRFSGTLGRIISRGL